jgi:hypothetical protein
MNVYGINLRSDIALPYELAETDPAADSIELRAVPPSTLRDASLHCLNFYSAHGRDVYLHTDRDYDGSEPGQVWCYEVEDVLRFSWRGGEGVIYYDLGAQGDARLLGFWFIHLLLPLFLTLEDRYDFLHAGAVAVDDRPILFIAPSMGGKSTMTDYFVSHGHALVADDKVATFRDDGRFMLTGSHPYHRPYRKFEDLGYHVDNFLAGRRPIHAIYHLDAAEADAPVAISEVLGYQKFDTLMPNYLFMFSYLRARRLEYLGSLLNAIRLFRVSVPWDMQRLGEVHDAITEHSRKIT